jgi:hypothetical protein
MEGASILSVGDERESAYIAGRVAAGSQTWLDLVKNASSGNWDSKSSFRKWLPNEPMMTGTRAVVASLSGNYGWKAVLGSQFSNVICEKVNFSICIFLGPDYVTTRLKLRTSSVHITVIP